MSETATKKKTLAQKLLDIQSDVDHLKKDKHNKFHNYDYVSETNVIEAVRNLFVKHGVMAVPSVEHSWQETRLIQTANGEKHDTHSYVQMKYTLIDTETQEQMEVFWMGEGQDGGDKGYYKAYTGSQKYFLMKTFMIPTGDDPEAGNGQQQAPSSAEAPEGPTPKTAGGATIRMRDFARNLLCDVGACRHGMKGESDEDRIARRAENTLGILDWFAAHEVPIHDQESPLEKLTFEEMHALIEDLKAYKDGMTA